MKNVLDTNLTGKVAVVTGAGGVLWFGVFAHSWRARAQRWRCWI